MAVTARITDRTYHLGRLAILSLVLLRFAVGWHFFKEGFAKLRNPSFSSRAFLQEARGPWVTTFWSFIDDPLALARLDEAKVGETWQAYFTSLAASRTADKSQQAKLAEAESKWKGILADYFRGIAPKLAEYRAKAEPLALSMRNAREQSQPFVNQQTRARLAELQQMRAPWLTELRQLEQLMQAETSRLAGSTPHPTAKAQLSSHSKNWIDHAVTCTTLSVGVLLLVGLLVPVASLVGCGFLLSVMLTQPFWVPGANLTYAYYQGVEIAALLVLATTSAGRFAGLDFFWSLARRRTLP